MRELCTLVNPQLLLDALPEEERGQDADLSIPLFYTVDRESAAASLTFANGRGAGVIPIVLRSGQYQVSRMHLLAACQTDESLTVRERNGDLLLGSEYVPLIKKLALTYQKPSSGFLMLDAAVRMSAAIYGRARIEVNANRSYFQIGAGSLCFRAWILPQETVIVVEPGAERDRYQFEALSLYERLRLIPFWAEERKATP